MIKRMIIMLVLVGILFGGIFALKALEVKRFKKKLAAKKQIFTVSTVTVDYQPWLPTIKAAGSLRAIQGVNVTTELAGMVQSIYFKPGSYVKKGTVLVQLNADSEIGQLKSLQANEALARITYNRDKAQYAIRAVSKQTVDTDRQNLKSLEGQVAEQKATVEKKTIRAPFTGRLGISNVDLGQYINTGDTVVTLQTLDPIYADFYLPQQDLDVIKVGQPVIVTSDTFPKQIFKGKITTINPLVDVSSRNVEVEGTIKNPKRLLQPGMFAYVTVTTGKAEKYLTIPQAAVSFNPYGEIIYLVKEKGKDEKGNPILIAQEKFIETGRTRGNQIIVKTGLKKGDVIVSSGQLKLRNNVEITINNTVQPSDNPNPQLSNEHTGLFKEESARAKTSQSKTQPSSKQTLKNHNTAVSSKKTKSNHTTSSLNNKKHRKYSTPQYGKGKTSKKHTIEPADKYLKGF